MRASPSTRWQGVRERAGRFMRGPAWRRRLVIAILIVGTQAGALGIAYRAVVLHNHTLLTGSILVGTEASAPPFGYPGMQVPGFNEVDAGASAWQFVPQIRKAHEELAAGRLPLWSANVMLGAPLAGDAIHGMFNPFTWPLLARPTVGKWDAWLLTRLLVAGVLASALALYLGLRPVPASLAGLVYMLSGVFQLRTTTIQTGVMAVLPLLVLTVEYCVRSPSRRSAAALAGAVAATVLFGMPEQSFICLLMAAIYFVVRWAATWKRGSTRANVRVLSAAGGGAVVGVLAGLPQMLPFAEYLGLAATSHTATAHAALQVENPAELLRLVGPHWTGAGPFYSTGWSPFDNWFGAGALFLAILGVFTRSFPRGVRALLVVTAIVVEAKVVGVPGWWNQLVGNLPVIDRIAFWAYSGVLVSLAVALLAGAGLQRLRLREATARQVLIAAAALTLAIAGAAPILLNGQPVVGSAIALTVVTIVVVADGARLALRDGARARAVGLVMVVGGTALELVLLATPGIELPARYDPLAPTPTTAYLQKAMPSGSGRSYSATQILYPSTSQAFNLDDIRNLDALYIERTYRYLKDFVVPGLDDRFDGIYADAAHYIGNHFFDALNVDYVLVAPSAGPPPTLPADQFPLATVAADGVAIYRNLHAAPRAQVVFDLAVASSEQQAATLMHRQSFDPTRSAVVESTTAPAAANMAPVPASVVSYTDSRVVMTASTDRAGMLVLADAYYPGWVADVDGVAAPIVPVDVAFRGVAMPAGTHTVTMEYRPRSVVLGALGVPAGLVVFAAGAWGPSLGRRLTRRAPRP